MTTLAVTIIDGVEYHAMRLVRGPSTVEYLVSDDQGACTRISFGKGLGRSRGVQAMSTSNSRVSTAAFLWFLGVLHEHIYDDTDIETPAQPETFWSALAG